MFLASAGDSEGQIRRRRRPSDGQAQTPIRRPRNPGSRSVRADARRRSRSDPPRGREGLGKAMSMPSRKDNMQAFADVQALVFDVFGTVVDWRSGVAREMAAFLARCLVAAHNGDLAAARRCGLLTAFIPRPTEHGPGQTTDLGPERGLGRRKLLLRLEISATGRNSGLVTVLRFDRGYQGREIPSERFIELVTLVALVRKCCPSCRPCRGRRFPSPGCICQSTICQPIRSTRAGARRASRCAAQRAPPAWRP